MFLRAGYLFDEREKAQAIKNSHNYWWSYIVEILDRLGLTANKVSPEQLPEKLGEFSILFLGDFNAISLAGELDGWVKSGGILIGSNVEGLDEIFGNEFIDFQKQKNGEFSISGKFFLKESPFAREIHSLLHPEKLLLAASPLRRVKTIKSSEIAADGTASFITGRSCGKGWAFYFGFDLAQTFWVIQQGKPIDKDYDGDGYWRTGDAIVIEDNEPEVAYTDELLFLLQNMVRFQPHPLIHQIPPKDGKIPDFIFYHPGDDEGHPENQVQASDFMASRNLPYHINLMSGGDEKSADGKFAINEKEEKKLIENNTELSLHFNFMDGFSHPCGYTKDDVRKQVEFYVRRFGKTPVSANCHWCRWTGWSEPALWMKEMGIKSDHSRIHIKSPPLNPVNEIGFSFGTSFPSFFWSDHLSGNERIEFLELPIIAYECGYNQNNETDFSKLEKVILLAKHYQLIMNLFYHPVYIAKYPACRQAIDKLISLMKEQELNPLHLGLDEVTTWWFNRNRTKIERVKFEDGKLTFLAFTPHPEGFIAKIPLGNLAPLKINFPHKIINKFGKRWLFLVLPSGEKKVVIDFS